MSLKNAYLIKGWMLGISNIPVQIIMAIDALIDAHDTIETASTLQQYIPIPTPSEINAILQSSKRIDSTNTDLRAADLGKQEKRFDGEDRRNSFRKLVANSDAHLDVEEASERTMIVTGSTATPGTEQIRRDFRSSAKIRPEHLVEVKNMLCSGKSLRDIGTHYAPDIKAPYQMALAYCKAHGLDTTPAGRERLRIDSQLESDSEAGTIDKVVNSIDASEIKIPSQKPRLKPIDLGNITSLFVAGFSLEAVATDYAVTIDEMGDFLQEYAPEKWQRIREARAREQYLREKKISMPMQNDDPASE